MHETDHHQVLFYATVSHRRHRQFTFAIYIWIILFYKSETALHNSIQVGRSIIIQTQHNKNREETKFNYQQTTKIRSSWSQFENIEQDSNIWNKSLLWVLNKCLRYLGRDFLRTPGADTKRAFRNRKYSLFSFKFLSSTLDAFLKKYESSRRHFRTPLVHLLFNLSRQIIINHLRIHFNYKIVQISFFLSKILKIVFLTVNPEEDWY